VWTFEGWMYGRKDGCMDGCCLRLSTRPPIHPRILLQDSV
jgi:hypothetical protein